MWFWGGPPTFPHAICENISPVEWLSQFIAPKSCTTTSASAWTRIFLISPHTDESVTEAGKFTLSRCRREPNVLPSTSLQTNGLQINIGRCRDLEKRRVYENKFTAFGLRNRHQSWARNRVKLIFENHFAELLESEMIRCGPASVTIMMFAGLGWTGECS